MPVERVVVVANPTAGRGKGRRALARADRILRELRIDFEVRITESAQHLEAAAREAAESGAEIVAALGGDGTIGYAANGVLGTGAALAVLPAGTANDFAKTIGAWRLDDATRLLANPKIRPVDVVRLGAGVSERHYVNIAGAGFDSEVNETANRMRVKLGGTGTYVAAVIKTLSRFTPANFRIEVDGRSLELDAMLVVVGSGVAYGGGMRVLPDAVVDDGLLDICVVEALSTPAFLRAFPKVFSGTHPAHPKVRMLTGRRVEIDANRRVQVYADGERAGSLPALFEVVPRSLRVVTGPSATGFGKPSRRKEE